MKPGATASDRQYILWRDEPLTEALMTFHHCFGRSCSVIHSRSQAFSRLAAIGLLCWPMMCGAQMVGPTPQPQGIPVTPEQAEQVEQETWAIHGQATNVWLDRKSVV